VFIVSKNGGALWSAARNIGESDDFHQFNVEFK
jgi:hypothetical protein